MGRRGVSVEDHDRWVFNRIAGHYSARPAYPRELIERLVAIAPGPNVVELGAGTGLLALPLAEAGLKVTAVEPARKMLDVLAAAAHPGVVCVHAAAEATGLPEGAFDVAVFADAAHWVDPELAGREVARLLGDAGVCAVVEPRWAETEFMRDFAALLARVNPKARPPSTRGGAQLLDHARKGSAQREGLISQEVAISDDALVPFLRSLSHVGPALGDEKVEALADEIRALGARHGGVKFARELVLRWA